MTTNPRERQEIIAIIMAAAAGEASEEQIARISNLILEDDEWSTYVLNVMGQEAWLTWHASKARLANQSSTEQFDHNLTITAPPLKSLPIAASRDALSDWIPDAATELSLNEPTRVYRALRMATSFKRLSLVPVIAATLLLVIGALLGVVGNRWYAAHHGPIGLIADSDAGGRGAGEVIKALASYEARLMHGTACVWAPDIRSRLDSHDALRSGDSLNLIAGLAELQLSWPMRGNATLRLEGPAGLVLMADRGASLTYGKLTANVSLQYDSFVIETPVGRVVVNDNSNIGVAVSSSGVEVHVFSGEAEVAAPWTSGMQTIDGLRVHNGRSIRLKATDSGKIDLVRGPASPSRFASEVSMSSDLLEIPEEYVDAVRKAAPVVYWRFDAPVNNQVKNAMGTHYNARVIGKPNWVDERGNESVEFGTGLNADELHALIVADEPFKNLERQSYSIELWAKPSHYHLGTMFALVTPADQKDAGDGMHGVLFELGGPRAFYSSIEHPGRVRFLHRNPPSYEPALGTSCFSNEPYALRKWQHLVAVKDKTEMRLYVDAKLMASAADNSPLAGDFEVVVGQIDRKRDMRPFVGQLDELAFYNRALSSEEIEQHYRIVRPKLATKREI